MSERTDNQGYVATILEEHLFSSLGNQTRLIFFHTDLRERIDSVQWNVFLYLKQFYIKEKRLRKNEPVTTLAP